MWNAFPLKGLKLNIAHVPIRGGVIIFGLLPLGLLFIYQERNKGLFIRGWPMLTEAPAFTKPLQQAKWLSTILVMYIIINKYNIK
jgi:hypothetical protein